MMKKVFLILLLLSFKTYANSLGDVEVIKILQCQGKIKCQESSSYGGPCYDGFDGPLYNGHGGACYSGAGGPLYDGYGGRLYDGYDGPLYNGFGGDCYNGYGGPCDSNSKTELPLRCSTLCK